MQKGPTIPHLKQGADPTLPGKGERFVNFFADFVSFYVFSLILGVFIGLIIIAFPESSLYGWVHDGEDPRPMFRLVVNLSLLLIFYTLTEYFSGGKTPGKYFTKTRAIRKDGYKLTFRNALLRSIIRLVPFDPFSFLGNRPDGWHDEWTDTQVIFDKDWKNPR